MGFEALELAVLAKEKGGKMPAVSIAEAAGTLFVVLRKEEGGKSAVGRYSRRKGDFTESRKRWGCLQNKGQRRVGAME